MIIERFYNICLFRLTGIPFLYHSISQQFQILKLYNSISFKISFFFKFFKNDIVFKNLGYLRHTYEVKVPFERTYFGLARLSVFFPKFINIIFKISYYLKLSFSDFCICFFSNIFILFDNLITNFDNF